MANNERKKSEKGETAQKKRGWGEQEVTCVDHLLGKQDSSLCSNCYNSLEAGRSPFLDEIWVHGS
jgi:hypothetical protein